MIRAFLFDLDGTLVDSMPHHRDAWIEWRARRGLPLDATDFASTAGRSIAEILVDMFPALALDELAAIAAEKEAIYREFAVHSLALIRGAQAFVGAARDLGVPLAVCTAGTPENIALAFSLHGIDRWVQTVVSPADGLRGKPHPDLFLEAARRLGVAPASCIVFEDAPLGVEAALRAGMPAVALTTTLPASEFAGFPNVIAIEPDFSALDPIALTREQHHA
jgi:beta-phosphoglucomutase